MTEKTGPLNVQEVKEKCTRRDFTKSVLKGLGVGSLFGIGTKVGLDAASDNLASIVKDAEEYIRELALDVRALSGDIERKLVEQRIKLEENYTDGRLRIYEELELATPAEIKEFEQIINNLHKFEEHYSFVERARIFKDRIDKRLLSLDAKIEEWQPDVEKKLNDFYRKLFGKKTGKEGVKYREEYRKRLTTLCRIYDTNEDNRVAQTKVLEKINHYLENTKDMLPEEKELYNFLRDQYSKEDRQENIREFIKNYDQFEGRQQSLIKLRAYISEAEDLYDNIKENKKYMMTLQDLLKQGIDLKQELRDKSQEEFEKHRKDIEARVNNLNDAVDDIIFDLKSKGYDIETRKDYIEGGHFSRAAEAALKPYIWSVAIATGLVTGALTWWADRKNAMLRTAEKALAEVVDKYNDNHIKSENNN